MIFDGVSICRMTFDSLGGWLYIRGMKKLHGIFLLVFLILSSSSCDQSEDEFSEVTFSKFMANNNVLIVKGEEMDTLLFPPNTTKTQVLELIDSYKNARLRKAIRLANSSSEMKVKLVSSNCNIMVFSYILEFPDGDVIENICWWECQDGDELYYEDC